MGEKSTTSRGGAPAGWGGTYLLCMIGAWVFFWPREHGFGGHVWALVEGVLWPAFMTYRAFHALY